MAITSSAAKHAPEILLIALEGGGTRSQAAVLDAAGQVLALRDSTDVNTNFVSFELAQAAAVSAVAGALEQAGISGAQVTHVATSLVGARFGPDTFSALCPGARFVYYGEREVVFARASVYRPHGVALVAATGATATALRADDGRSHTVGGWGSLLGDEGSAYAMGLLGLRAAVRAYENRTPAPTRLVQAVCDHFALTPATFQSGLIKLAYRKPLSRADIAGFSPRVTALAQEGDPVAQGIVAKVTADLSALLLHAARPVFASGEEFVVVAAGGLLNAGELILGPLRDDLAAAYPHAVLTIGSEAPAIALGRLALYHIANAAQI